MFWVTSNNTDVTHLSLRRKSGNFLSFKVLPNLHIAVQCFNCFKECKLCKSANQPKLRLPGIYTRRVFRIIRLRRSQNDMFCPLTQLYSHRCILKGAAHFRPIPDGLRRWLKTNKLGWFLLTLLTKVLSAVNILGKFIDETLVELWDP